MVPPSTPILARTPETITCAKTIGLISAVGLVVAPLVTLAGPAERTLGPRILKHYDTNQDRTITAAEVAAVNRSELETHDADQSGSLSLAEFERVARAHARTHGRSVPASGR